jgi:hypothetical protein
MKINSLKLLFLTMMLGTSSNAVASSVIELLQPSLKTSYAVYDRASPFSSERHYFNSELLLDINSMFAEGFQLQLKPQLRFANHNQTNNKLQYREKDASRPTATLKEAHLSYFGERYEIALGKQIFSWGKADLINPTDDLNPVDILDPLNSKKLGQSALSVRYLGDKINLHGVVLIEPDPSRTPTENSRWFRSTVPIQQAVMAQLGFTPEIQFTDPEFEQGLRYGLQLTSSTLAEGWDIELSYFHGYEPVGVYDSTFSGTQLLLNRAFPEFDEWGLGFSSVVDDYEFHAVLSYHDNRDQLMDDDYFTALLGARSSFYEIPFADFIEEITLGVEYVKEQIVRKKTADSRYVQSGFARMMTDSLLSKLQLKFSEDNHLELIALYNFSDKDRYLGIEYRHKWSDSLELSLRLDQLSGASGTLFGEWSHNDRLFIESSYHF